MKKNNYFKLYSYNIPILGKKSAIIVSLQDRNYTQIPQFLCEVLTDYDNISISDIEKAFDDTSKTIVKYFETLENKGLGFFTSTPENFPKINLEWDSPEIIKSAVIQINSIDKLDYTKLFKDLNELGCKHIELWVFGNYSLNTLIDILSSTNDSVLRSISLITSYKDNIEKLKESLDKLLNIYLYNCPERIKNTKKGIYGITTNLENSIDVFKNYEKDEYIIYKDFFLESIKHNPFYNKKICIDVNGDIKNCLTHKKNFGNINNQDIKKVVDKNEFKELWFANNDKVEDVNESEFRYIWFNSFNLKKIKTDKYKMIS